LLLVYNAAAAGVVPLLLLAQCPALLLPRMLLMTLLAIDRRLLHELRLLLWDDAGR